MTGGYDSKPVSIIYDKSSVLRFTVKPDRNFSVSLKLINKSNDSNLINEKTTPIQVSCTYVSYKLYMVAMVLSYSLFFIYTLLWQAISPARCVRRSVLPVVYRLPPIWQWLSLTTSQFGCVTCWQALQVLAQSLFVLHHVALYVMIYILFYRFCFFGRRSVVGRCCYGYNLVAMHGVWRPVSTDWRWGWRRQAVQFDTCRHWLWVLVIYSHILSYRCKNLCYLFDMHSRNCLGNLCTQRCLHFYV